MGKQTGFFAVEEDLFSLLEYAENLGMAALPRIVSTDLAETEGVAGKSPVSFAKSLPEEIFYLLPQGIPEVEVFYHEFSTDPTRSRLAADVSPVIQVLPCKHKAGQIINGRIHLSPSPSDRLYNKSNSAYNKLSKFIRKWESIKEYPLFVGPSTARMSRSGDITLMYGQIEVHLDRAES